MFIFAVHHRRLILKPTSDEDEPNNERDQEHDFTGDKDANGIVCGHCQPHL